MSQYDNKGQSHLYVQASSWLKSALDFVLPPRCVSCERPGSSFCQTCAKKVSWIKEPICICCGRFQTATKLCGRCQERPLPLTQIRAAAHFSGPIPKAIHHLKYKNAFGLAGMLADLMEQAWPKWAQTFDIAVPVPLHANRERQRGYNQSTLLLRELAKRLDWPVDFEAVHRVRTTQPQTTLTLEERAKNVAGAFRAKERVAGNRVLLVDDVCTTGATLAATPRPCCNKALRPFPPTA